MKINANTKIQILNELSQLVSFVVKYYIKYYGPLRQKNDVITPFTSREQ